MEGVVAAVLLIRGGLSTLQTASVSTGLPFAFVLLIGVYSLYVGFSEEAYIEDAVEKAVIDAEEDQRLQEVITSAVNAEIQGT